MGKTTGVFEALMSYRCWIAVLLSFKVAPYSFTIARALRTKASSSNLRALEGKRQCFSIFYYVNMSTTSKTDSEFSRVSFGEIP